MLSSSAIACSSATDFCFSSAISTTVRSGEGSSGSLARETAARMCQRGAGRSGEDRAPRNATRWGVGKDDAAGQGATACEKCQGNVLKKGGQV